MVEKDGYLRFTKNVRELKTAKEALREEGYPLAKVRELVSSIIRPVRFPPGAILLPAPSTTGTNIIPRVIAAELGRAQGIEVVVGVLATRNIVKTANKSGLGKLRDPIRLDVVGDLEKLKGKRVYVVDDVVTTGETTDTMREILASQGIFVAGVVSLGQSEVRHVKASDILRINTKLGDPPLLNEIRTVLNGRLKHRANYIERTINERSKSEIRQHLVSEARRIGKLDPRTRFYLGNAQAMASRLQLGQGGGPRMGF